MKKTVTILPETEGSLLCLSLTGVIKPEDFAEFFEKPLQAIIAQYDHYSLFVVYDEAFEGWSEEAADLSFKCISAISPKARKAAYLNAPDYRHLLMKMVQPLTHLEVRYFDSGQEQEALNWLKD
jgi:hypothetical protein